MVPIPAGSSSGDVLIFGAHIPEESRTVCPLATPTEVPGEYSVLVPKGLGEGQKFRVILPSCLTVRDD